MSSCKCGASQIGHPLDGVDLRDIAKRGREDLISNLSLALAEEAKYTNAVEGALASVTHPRLYIAGPMTGKPEFNYPAFHDAADKWRHAGWLVTNPAEKFNGDVSLPYQTYIKAAIQQVLECSAVAVLPGWETSVGARLEVHIASVLGMPVYDAAVPFDDQFERGQGVIIDLDTHSVWQDIGIDPTVDAFGKLLHKMQRLHDAKKADYTGGNHPLHNYVNSSRLAGIEPKQGMFSRMCEKVMRLSNLIGADREAQVADESVNDTLLDIAIISLLMILLLTPGSGYEE